MKRLQAYCVRRIIFSVIFVVLLCSIVGCGQAHTATVATTSSTHIIPTPTVPTPKQTSSVLGHILTEDGWDITLASARFDDTYPIAEQQRSSDGTVATINHDWLLVLHLVVKNVSNQDTILLHSQFTLGIEPVGSSAMSNHRQYTPADDAKALPYKVPLGDTTQGDLIYSIDKGGLTEHGVVNFALYFLPTDDPNSPIGGWQLFTFSAS